MVAILFSAHLARAASTAQAFDSSCGWEWASGKKKHISSPSTSNTDYEKHNTNQKQRTTLASTHTRMQKKQSQHEAYNLSHKTTQHARHTRTHQISKPSTTFKQPSIYTINTISTQTTRTTLAIIAQTTTNHAGARVLLCCVHCCVRSLVCCSCACVCVYVCTYVCAFKRVRMCERAIFQ